ncbi:hypothetical protein AbraIFM66951_005733 [Aspergillus brasiliensis]|uniref:Velvet domain-containing protein n=2 Tax=Aspergillus brasiliensis TaxID=319629 RepID=A0A1L9UXE0_ASPBC|nr:hypothetical protein ASPBRDRAFT_192436 [Aspergillus brasiliensis CBS 101740]GKZ17004.1 hypothetical protein AbraCBS73388_005992 [Aspergillus brasiliensis]GKZ44015.1 hypothetical protein AbraIFM66951_005733 [Aspergillus brasiliensis]
MVQGNGRTDGGSSSREYGMNFEIAPPTTVPLGVPVTLPVVVGVRPVGNPRGVQQLVAHASLRNEAGTAPASGLTGVLTSSVRSRNGNGISGYARFGPLKFTQPGRYRLRVMLGAASFNGVTTKEYVESGIIQVQAGAATPRPTPTQVSKLQSLIPENIDISAADIATWQSA